MSRRLALLALLVVAMGASASRPAAADQQQQAGPLSQNGGGGGGVAFPPGVDKLGAGLFLCRGTGDGVEILLLKRRSKHHGGAWGLPGGNVEAGDASLLACAAREAQEELGGGGAPPFAVRARLDTRRGKRGQKAYSVFVAAVEEADASVFSPALNEEHSEHRWFAAREVERLARAALAATGGGGGGGGGGSGGKEDKEGDELELHPVVALAMREAGWASGLGRLLLEQGGASV
jgi:8-oxo-dGTP pyrophosphatase MutT (NUDIX family)